MSFQKGNQFARGNPPNKTSFKKGEHRNPETEFKKGEMRLKQLGENNSNWKGGISLLDNQIRNCYKYRQWVSDNFTRDNYICQECGYSRGGILEVHHIIRLNEILNKNKIKTVEEALNCEELWNINNGITLCKNCHKNTTNYGKKKNI